MILDALEALYEKAPQESASAVKRDVEALIAAGGRSLRGLISLARAGSSRDARSLACWALGRLGSRAKGGLSTLVEVVTVDPNEVVVFTAAKALVELKATSKASAMVDALSEGRYSVNRAAAAWTLGNLQVTKALPGLVAVATNRREAVRVRSHALEALGDLRDPRAVEPLIGVLRESRPEVRFWSAFALGKIGDARALPHLKVLTSDQAVVPKWWGVGREARDAIRSIKNTAAWTRRKRQKRAARKLGT